MTTKRLTTFTIKLRTRLTMPELAAKLEGHDTQVLDLRIVDEDKPRHLFTAATKAAHAQGVLAGATVTNAKRAAEKPAYTDTMNRQKEARVVALIEIINRTPAAATNAGMLAQLANEAGIRSRYGNPWNERSISQYMMQALERLTAPLPTQTTLEV